MGAKKRVGERERDGLSRAEKGLRRGERRLKARVLLKKIKRLREERRVKETEECTK